MARLRIYFIPLVSVLVTFASVAFSAAAAAVQRAVARAFDIAFPATAAVTYERSPLAAELVSREVDRHRTAAFVTRRTARTKESHRGAPLNAGTASAGVAFA